MGNTDSTFMEAIEHQKNNQLDLAEKKYLLIANNISKYGSDLYKCAIISLAKIYYEQNKLNLAEKYYVKALANGDRYALESLGDIYEKTNRYKAAEIYYLDALKYNYHDGLIPKLKSVRQKIKELDKKNKIDKRKENMEIFSALTKIPSPDKTVIDRMNKMKADSKEIRIFANKINNASKNGECQMCNIQKLLLQKECTDWLCQDCYIKYDICPICHD